MPCRWILDARPHRRRRPIDFAALAEAAGRVVRRLDPSQSIEVRAVVRGVRLVEVRIGEVRVDTAGAPRMGGRPGRSQPASGRALRLGPDGDLLLDRKSTRLNSSHLGISYAVFCLK